MVYLSAEYKTVYVEGEDNTLEVFDEERNVY